MQGDTLDLSTAELVTIISQACGKPQNLCRSSLGMHSKASLGVHSKAVKAFWVSMVACIKAR